MLPKLLWLCRHFLLLAGAVMAVYSLYLLCLKKFHLGTILPLFIGLALVLYGLCHQSLTHYFSEHPLLSLMWQVALVVFWLWALSVLMFFGLIYQQTTKAQQHNNGFAAIIVLGSKATDGMPSPALASRLDVAAATAKHNPQAWLITTGGVGFGETISEADAAKAYLVQRHRLDDGQILSENQSTSTELNLKNSATLLQAHNISPKDKIAIVTSDFHTLRSQKIAQKQGFNNAVVIAAPTPLQTRYHSWLREYFAFISGFLLGEY